MGKYTKIFSDHIQYEAYIADTENLILPNVSLCINQKEVHYNPVIGVSGIEINKTELSLGQGSSETLEVIITPSNASNKNVIWASSDETVATVDENGTVTAVGEEGSAIITATTVDGGYSVECSMSIISDKVITYTATAKLPETTETDDYGSGLHVNSFSGDNGRLNITSHTFEDGIGKIEFDGDIKSIGNYAFYDSTGLISVNIPSSVTTFGFAVFLNCTSLTNVNIPSDVTIIDSNTFNNCTNLTSIVIPSGVTSIGWSGITNCTSLVSITFEAATPPTLGPYVFQNTNNCLIYVPAQSVEAYKSAIGWSVHASRIQAIQE